MTVPARRSSPRQRRLRLALAAGCVALLGGGGCASSGSQADGSSRPADQAAEVSEAESDGAGEGEEAQEREPSRSGAADDGGSADIGRDEEDDRAIIAEAVVSTVRVYDEPGGGDPIHELDHPREVGAPLTFLVDDRDGDWLEVLLPVRPNGSTGWLHTDDVTLTATSYRVVVELSEHRLTVYRGDERYLETDIGVGGDGTPTPPGRYYVTELLRPPEPDGPYGPYAFGLSGFSEVHLDFAGGEGVIGIHGTDDPSSIGRDVSNGCIRVDNEVIAEMASLLPLGTPVEIRA